jgi:hypothetical protein
MQEKLTCVLCDRKSRYGDHIYLFMPPQGANVLYLICDRCSGGHPSEKLAQEALDKVARLTAEHRGLPAPQNSPLLWNEVLEQTKLH